MSRSDDRMGNRFVFDASAGDEGGWPMPAMSCAARALLGALLEHASRQARGLRHRQHAVRLKAPHDKIGAALIEVLTIKFPMPAEGGELCVPTLDAAAFENGFLTYTIGELYALYLEAIAPAGRLGPVRDELLYVNDQERALLIAGLRTLHRERTTALTCHVIHALTHGQAPCSRAEFGLVDTEVLLARLGATCAPS